MRPLACAGLPSGPERRALSPRGCRREAALWRALWCLPNLACVTFDPPGAGKCMVVVVNGLLSNGRLPHAYYYKRPRPVEWSIICMWWRAEATQPGHWTHG